MRCTLSLIAVSLVLLTPALLPAAGYDLTNLVADESGKALFTDTNLQNAWGLAAGPTTPLWVANNGTGTSTVYNGQGQASALVVTIPPSGGGSPPSAPTGMVFNGGAGFETGAGQPSRFIFASEDGVISGWNPANGTSAVRMVDNPGAIYKGIALGNNGSGDHLYATDFHGGKIDVFDDSFKATSLSGNFTDPALPAGYAPFNIADLGGKLYVTYAQQDGAGEDDVSGPGKGILDVFDLNGNFEKRLVSTGDMLNAPWGLALAPNNFGEFSGALLVGNFGDGMINAYDPTTGNSLGMLLDGASNPLMIDGLWALQFGNGTADQPTNTLFFTAGPGDEAHGLLGKVSPAPEPAAWALGAMALLALICRRRGAR